MEAIKEIEKDKQLEGWWRFSISAAQIEAIKRFDVNAMNKFYEDNYDVIRMCARKQHRDSELLRNRYYTVEDYINQIYVDLPFYRYKNSRHLWYSMLLSCQLISHGGYKHRKSNILDYLSISIYKPIEEGSDLMIGDTIASKNDGFEQIPDEQLEKFDKFCMTIAARLIPFSKAGQMAFFNSI
ncbi:MAG: hypothetical protein K2M44_02695 [Clostridia bacterium]|nr:hypothetical protein [Clostridia bacterium]